MARSAQWVFPELRAYLLASKGHQIPTENNKQPPDHVGKTGDMTDTIAGSSSTVFRTASFMESELPWSVEQQLRWTTCSFIEDLAALVEIPDAPTVAAQLYVQRFYVLHSFTSHDRFLVATAALFLAAKTEEFPIKVRLMTECAMYLLFCTKDSTKEALLRKKTTVHSRRKRKNSIGKPVEMSASLGNNPEAAHAKHLDCLNALLEVIDVGQIEKTANKVLLLERIVVQTLAFEISIPQPFAYVAPLMEKLFALEAMHPSISYDDIRTLVYLLLADAAKSGLVLAFNCVELAAGALYLSCLYREQVSPNVATEKNEPWWSILGLSSQQLEDVARGLLTMYEDSFCLKNPGLGTDFKELWDRYPPRKNLPDLEYIKQLDADLQGSY